MAETSEDLPAPTRPITASSSLRLHSMLMSLSKGCSVISHLKVPFLTLTSTSPLEEDGNSRQ
ncbi:hypothetical protein FBU59_001842 [Linderina macrospora]|uniref:Uncharacterized protein n=1 Tax=Linderina macrospora TaxID=4868 RepID=A0ACC1JCN9_9FUNG|nr:hypothetical protein FBU59_001842 [Linderina macrospora]